jgi:hypothetical protein
MIDLELCGWPPSDLFSEKNTGFKIAPHLSYTLHETSAPLFLPERPENPNEA